MSAICGIIRFDGQSVESSELETMVKSSPYRGPDGASYYKHKNAGFAHLAFHLTPESVHEKQPLTSEDGRLVLVADVRLDNRDELFRKLELRKDPERVVTDPELILFAYRKWGKACVEHFLGDFVFSVWDSKAQSLFLARDALGAYSVSYHQVGKRFVFASETTAILDLPYVQAVINEDRVLRTMEFLPRDHKETFFNSVFYLPPAHCMEVSASGNKIWKYWDIDPTFQISYNSDEEYADHLLELVDQATASRLRCIGPVGVSLSGGMDSTLVAASAARQMKKTGLPQSRLMSFSYVFENLKACDERKYIEPVVEKYGLDAHYINGDSLWTFRHLKDHPIAKDYLWTNCYVNLPLSVARSAQQAGCRLLLNGQAGDSLFSGSNLTIPNLIRQRKFTELFNYLKRHSENLNWRRDVILQGLGPLAPGWVRQFYGQLRTNKHGTFINGLSDYNKQRIRRITTQKQDDNSLKHKNQRRYHAVLGASWTQGFAAVRSSGYNKFGIEQTSPLYDQRIVEFVLSIPDDRINQPGKTRFLQSNAMKKVLPKVVCERKQKTSFEPLLKTGLLKEEKDTVLKLLRKPLIVQQGWVEQSWLEQQSDAGENWDSAGYPLSICLHLELWLRAVKQQRDINQSWAVSRPALE